MAALHDSLLRIMVLIRKELLAVLKDTASRTILFIPVLMQGLLFGYAATYDLNNVPYALLDLSHGASSTALAAKLDGTGVFHRVANLKTQADIATAIDNGIALVALQIPPDFERRLSAGRPAPVQLILDGRNSTTAGLASAYIAAVVADFNTRELRAQPPPITLEVRAWYNPNLQTRWNFMPGMIASLSMMQVLMLAALSVAREREQGTFDQLLVTPMSPREIMIGKAVPSILIGLVQATLVLLLSLFWFDIPLAGHLVTLYFSLLMFMIASVGIGLSISAVSVNMQQAMVYSFVLIMPLMLLSGLTTPVQSMPHIFQVITMINPLRFGIDLLRRVYLEGVGLADVWQNFIPLIVISVVTLPLAAWLFRNRLV
jgi:ABC-2 type transport system permease protein